ncbi:hypothetical protein AN958_10448 [Leucoagaricus sp. SymC.cos]|nr:hypothetical protein AN958_10448 [Leucoagaricus sp. SymC.cos]
MADDGLATRRSRRSTAGNRMEAALAEMSLDETNKDLDDDNEFVNDKDEEDVFESDFASTDEEANQEDIDADEKAVHEEEKSARKAARARLEKRTAAAHAKHKATFNPQAIAPPVVKPKLTPKAVTMLDSSEPGSKAASRRAGQKRKSQRRHTVLNTSATDTRMRETEEKKASAPKKFKPTVKTYSQAELIQRALDNEEGNIKEHRNYLNVEEEKRKRARAIKMPAVEGPLLRWISKAEEEKFKVQVEVPQPQPPVPSAPTYGNYNAAQLSYYTQLYHYLASQTSALSSLTTSQAGSNDSVWSSELQEQFRHALLNANPMRSHPSSRVPSATSNQGHSPGPQAGSNPGSGPGEVDPLAEIMASLGGGIPGQSPGSDMFNLLQQMRQGAQPPTPESDTSKRDKAIRRIIQLISAWLLLVYFVFFLEPSAYRGRVGSLDVGRWSRWAVLGGNELNMFELLSTFKVQPQPAFFWAFAALEAALHFNAVRNLLSSRSEKSHLDTFGPVSKILSLINIIMLILNDLGTVVFGIGVVVLLAGYASPK